MIRQTIAPTPGYLPPTMVRTPWGDAAELRERKLRPGRGTPREEAERNQRERLFAAMVATVAEKGYEATTVADLVELSGRLPQRLLPPLRGQAGVLPGRGRGAGRAGARTVAGDESARAGDRARRGRPSNLIETIVAQPAAAKMCFVEVYAAGPEGAALVDRTIDASRSSPRSCSSRCPSARGCRSRWCARSSAASRR